MDATSRIYEYLLHGYDPTVLVTLSAIVVNILSILFIILITCNKKWFYNESRYLSLYNRPQFINTVCLTFILATIIQTIHIIIARYYVVKNIDFSFSNFFNDEKLPLLNFLPMMILFLSYITIARPVFSKNINFRKNKEQFTDDIGSYVTIMAVLLLLCLLFSPFNH